MKRLLLIVCLLVASLDVSAQRIRVRAVQTQQPPPDGCTGVESDFAVTSWSFAPPTHPNPDIWTTGTSSGDGFLIESNHTTYWMLARLGGIYRSLNSGQTWTQLPTGFNSADALLIFQNNSGIFVVACRTAGGGCATSVGPGMGLYKFRTATNSWSQVSDKKPGGELVELPSGELLFHASATSSGGNNVTYLSTDQGETWTQILGSLWSGLTQAFQRDPYTGYIWAGTEGAGVWRSTAPVNSSAGFTMTNAAAFGPGAPANGAGFGFIGSGSSSQVLYFSQGDIRPWDANTSTFPSSGTLYTTANLGMWFNDNPIQSFAVTTTPLRIYVGSRHSGDSNGTSNNSSAVYSNTYPLDPAGWTKYHNTAGTSIRSWNGATATDVNGNPLASAGRTYNVVVDSCYLYAVKRTGHSWRAGIPTS